MIENEAKATIKELSMNRFELFDGWITKTKLTQQMNLRRILLNRYQYKDGRGDEYYYEWK